MAGEDDSGGKDLYAVLELARGASDEEIRSAFKALAIQNHPDKHPGDAKAALRFKRINAAYQVLRDPERREQYDQLTAPVEDFADSALARHVVPAGPAPQVFEPEVRRRRRRVRKTAWSKGSFFVAVIGAVTTVIVIVAVVLDRRGEGGDSTPGAHAAAAEPAPLRPVSPPSIEGLARAGSDPLSAGTARTIGAPQGQAPIVASPSADFTGRTVTGDHWQLTVPQDWQDAHEAKGAFWQAPGDVGGLRPSVRVAIRALTGEPPEYFKDLDRHVPRGVVVESEVWEYDSKPDGLKRQGRVAPEGATPSRFIEFAVVSHGRAYEVTCTGPDDASVTQSLCEPMLGTLEIK